MGKIIAICATAVVALLVVGTYPIAGITVVALGIVFLFLVFGKNEF